MAGKLRPMSYSHHETFEWVLASPAGMKIPCVIQAWFEWPVGMTVKPSEIESLRAAFVQHFGAWYSTSGLHLSLGFSAVVRIDEDMPPYCFPQVAAFHLTQVFVGTVGAPPSTVLVGRRAKANEFEITAEEVFKSFTWNGVTTTLAGLRKGTGWTSDLIEENARVAEQDPDTLSPVDARYSKAVEYTVAKLEKEIAELRSKAAKRASHLREKFTTSQSVHDVDNEHLRVTAESFGHDIRITWTIHETVALHAVRIMGFRREGGLCPNGWAGAPENGTLEVDSRERSGTVVQHLEPGHTYYYTFYIPPWVEKSLILNDSNKSLPNAIARFQLRIPTTTEMQSFSEVLKQLEQGRSSSSRDQVSEELKSLRAQLRASFERHQGRAEIVRELFEEIKKNSTLSSADKRELEEQVEAEAEKLWRSRR